MKIRLGFFIALLIFTACSTFAQSVQYIYDFRNESKEVSIDKSYLALTAKTVSDLARGAEAVSTSLDYSRIHEDGDYHWSVISLGADISNGYYENAYEVLRSKPYLSGVEPVIVSGDELIASSRFFYLKLGSESSVDSLSQLLTETNCNFSGAVGTTRWVKIETTVGSTGNSMELANYFFETGFFRK